MKSLGYTAAFVLLLSLNSFAQRNHSEQSADFLKEKLALTDAQTAKLRGLQAEKAKAMAEWRTARKAQMERERAFMKDQRQKLNDMLTPEQREKLKSISGEKLRAKKTDSVRKSPQVLRKRKRQ